MQVFLVAFILLLGMLLAPKQAIAGWRECQQSVAEPGTNEVRVERNHQVCTRLATAVDPGRVDATACAGGVEMTFQDVTGTNYDASMFVYQCAGAGAIGVFSDCKLVSVDRDGDGAGDGLPLTGAEATLQFGLWGLSPDWYAFDLTNPSLRTVEMKVTCR